MFASLFLDSPGRCGDFAGAHQVTNVFLQKLVVAVEFVVLLANGFYAVKYVNERILKGFGMPVLD